MCVCVSFKVNISYESHATKNKNDQLLNNLQPFQANRKQQFAPSMATELLFSDSPAGVSNDDQPVLSSSDTNQLMELSFSIIIRNIFMPIFIFFYGCFQTEPFILYIYIHMHSIPGPHNVLHKLCAQIPDMFSGTSSHLTGTGIFHSNRTPICVLRGLEQVFIHWWRYQLTTFSSEYYEPDCHCLADLAKRGWYVSYHGVSFLTAVLLSTSCIIFLKSH